MTPSIEVSLNTVLIEGVQIKRPSRIGVGGWLAFWEEVAELEVGTVADLERESRASRTKTTSLR